MYRLVDILCIFVEYELLLLNDVNENFSKTLTLKWRTDTLLLKKVIDIIRYCMWLTYVTEFLISVYIISFINFFTYKYI